MNSSVARPLGAAAPTTTPRALSQTLCPAVVPATLGLAVSLAISGDAMLRAGVAGLAFPVWIAMTAASLVVLAGRADRAVPREAAAWLAAAVLFSAGLAWRNSDELSAFDFFAAVGSLVLAAASLAHPRSVLFAPRLRASARAALSAARSVAGGAGYLVFRDTAGHADARRLATAGQRAARVALVAGVLLVVFGSLLVSADPIFASFVRIPNLDIQAVVQHAVVIAILAWVLGGWARGALIEKSDAFARVGPPVIKLGSLEITTAFVTLIVLFVAFVAAQVGWLFGGEAFLRARTGLTAAAYARDGFFQMVFVVALVVPLLVATRAFLEPGFALARRHTMLALPVVALLGAIIASAALRMRLYIQYFGLSTDRVYALAFMAWLAFVLVWLSVTTLRGRARRFGPGLVLSALTTVAGLNVMVPDVIVARVNVARARASAQPLDVAYLANLSGEASAWAVESALAEARAVPVPAQPFDRCATFNRIVQRWGLGSPARTRVADWRSWNAAESHAVRVVRAHDAEIEQIRTTACAAAKAASAAAKPLAPPAQR